MEPQANLIQDTEPVTHVETLHSPVDDSLDFSESDYMMITEYIQALNSWQFSKSIPNFSYLGDVCDSILHARFPDPPRKTFPAGPHYFPLKICLLGSQFSGRHTNAKVLETRYGLKSFEIEKILEDKNKVLERKQELEEGKKPKKVQEDESEIFIEEAVNSGDKPKDRARLLRAKLRGLFGDEPKVEEEQKKNTKKEEVKCQGWIVIGFPKTAEEAEEIEQELGGFIDSRHMPPNLATIKKRESWIISEPSGRTIRKPKLEKSVFDLIFKFEVPSHILVKRAVDRRVDANGNIYNLSFNPPPDNLLPKLKPIENPNEEEILRNFEEFTNEKPSINAWLQKFGVNNWSSYTQITETKLDLVKELIDKRIQEWLKIREELSSKPESSEVLVEFHETEGLMSIKEVKSLYEEWVVLKNEYLRDLAEVLSTIYNIRNDLSSASDGIFNEFSEFLCREDHKQTLIDPFIEKLSKLLESQVIISTKSRKNLMDELDNLSDQLWDIIEGRKEENLKYLNKLIIQDPCLNLMASVLNSIKSLISIEINKLVRSFNLISRFDSLLTKSDSATELIAPELNIDTNIENPEYGEDILNSIILKGRELLLIIPESQYKAEGVLQYQLRLEEIQLWGNKNLASIMESSKKIFIILDKWIGDAIKAENDAANELINAWKASVRDRRVTELRVIRDNSMIRDYLTRELVNI